MLARKRYRFRAVILGAMIGPLLVYGCTSGTDEPPVAETAAPSARDCGSCHTAEYLTWAGSIHANSQQNGPELAGDVGHSPAEQIEDEDCISCHGPMAVTANGGMTEAESLGYFYTTAEKSGKAGDKSYDAGDFYPDTVATNVLEWPNIACQTCHDKSQQMTADAPLVLALFDSHEVDATTNQQGIEKPIGLPSALCGQCHGSLHAANQATDDAFPGGAYSDWCKWTAKNPTAAGNWKGTNHLLHDGWKLSGHGHTQNDVAGELAGERADQTPDDLINGADAEDCIGCHAPTAVQANGGMDEVAALDYFFTTTNGKFTADTKIQHASEWPNVDCVACHSQHNPDELAYYNSATKKHEPMASAEQLCGQCHGDLRFPESDHLSYNIMQGTGGVGVPDQQTMLGATCTDCHMAVDNTTWPGEHHFNQYMTHGHTWQVIVNGGDKDHHPENHPGWTGWSMGSFAGDNADHGDGAGNGEAPHMASCTQCHAGMDSQTVIAGFKAEFEALDAMAQQNVAAATKAMAGVTDATLKSELDAVQHNLTYADADESGGFHNHKYLMALVNDANTKALDILSKAVQ